MTLSQVFEAKFRFSSAKANKIARFFVAGTATSESPESRDQNQKIDIETFIKRLKEYIPQYENDGLYVETMLFNL